MTNDHVRLNYETLLNWLVACRLRTAAQWNHARQWDRWRMAYRPVGWIGILGRGCNQLLRLQFRSLRRRPMCASRGFRLTA